MLCTMSLTINKTDFVGFIRGFMGTILYFGIYIYYSILYYVFYYICHYIFTVILIYLFIYLYFDPPCIYDVPIESALLMPVMFCKMAG